MPNHLTRQRRRKRLLDQATNQEEAKKSTTVIDKNAWFSGTEALKEEERKREDLILQGGLGAQKPKEATQKKAEAAESRAKIQTFDEFLEEVENRHRAAMEENMKKAEAAESRDKIQTFDESLEEVENRHRANKENLKKKNAIEDRDTEDYVEKTAEIEGEIREMNVGTESEAAALKKSIKDLERVMSNTARLIGEKRARLFEIKSERKKAEALSKK